MSPTIFSAISMIVYFIGMIMIGLWAYVRTAEDRKSTRLNSSHLLISYAVFCLKKRKIGRAHV